VRRRSNDHLTTPISGTSFSSITIRKRLLNTRGFPVFLAIVVFIPILVGMAAVGAWRLTNAPYFGFNFGSFSGNVKRASDAWPGVEPGDLIVAINGVQVEGDPARVRQAMLALEPGPATFAFRRDGQTFAVTSDLKANGLAARVAVWTRVATGAILLLIGAIAFVMQPGTRVAWLFIAFSTALGTHLLGYLALLTHPPEALILEKVGMYWAAALGIHLFTVFPLDFSTPFPAISKIPYAIASAATIVMVGFYRVGGARGIVVKTILATQYVGAVGGLIALALVFVQYRHARRGIRRDDRIVLARARALVIGVLLGLAIPAALGPILTPITEFGWTFASFLVIVFAGVTAWSIVRHNALDVDRFTAAVLGYITTTAGLVVIFVVLLVGMTTLMGSTGILRSPVTSATATAAFFIVFNPVYRKVRRRVDRIFSREDLEEDIVLGLLHDLANSVRTAKLEEIFDKALAVATSLGAGRAELWERESDGRFGPSRSAGPLTVVAVPDPVTSTNPLAKALRTGSGGIGDLVDRPYAEDAQNELWNRDLAFAAPVFVDQDLRAFIAASRKTNGTAFSRRERALIDTVASHLGIAIEHYDSEEKKRFGPYRTIRRLGTGGMAEVYLAEKRGPGGFELKVAIKRMLPHVAEDPDSVKMFLDEARIAAKLQHPNIVRIFDIEEYEGSYWLAMELMDGPHLGQMIRWADSRHLVLPLPIVSTVATAVLEALAFAHRATDEAGGPLRIVHRDVKPGNILTSLHGEVKLADFGIARAEFRLYQTQTGVVRGTPAYMAPEQREGYTVGPAADIFSAGAVLYEALTGILAYREQKSGSELRPPSEIIPTLPKALDTVIARAMAPNPADRFASAEEMLDAFRAALGGVKPASQSDIAVTAAEIQQSMEAPPRPIARKPERSETVDLG